MVYFPDTESETSTKITTTTRVSRTWSGSGREREKSATSRDTRTQSSELHSTCVCTVAGPQSVCQERLAQSDDCLYIYKQTLVQS